MNYESIVSIKDLFKCIQQFLDDRSILTWVHCNKRHSAFLPWVTVCGSYEYSADSPKIMHRIGRFRSVWLSFRDAEQLEQLTVLANRVERMRLCNRAPLIEFGLLRHLPLGLRSLEFDLSDLTDFDERLFHSRPFFPTTLTEMYIRYDDKPLLSGIFPASLQTLTLYLHDQIISNGILPNSLTSLTIQSQQKALHLHQFPSSLQHLHWHSSLIEPIADLRYLSSLRSLSVEAFDGLLLNADSLLPPSLEELALSYEYEGSFNFTALPRSLKVLKKCSCIGRNMAEWLHSLEYLSISRNVHGTIDFTVPLLRLKVLDLSHLRYGWPTFFPEGLEELTINNIVAERMHNLPSSLLTLKCCRNCRFTGPIQVLPPRLQHLEFGDAFNHVLARGVLPDSLVFLLFGRRSNKVLPPLPLNLERLTFAVLSDYMFPFLHAFPPHLRVVTLPHDYCHPFPFSPCLSKLRVIKQEY